MDQYLENIRELERRIQAVEAKNSSGEERALPEAPTGVPDSFAEHMQLMFDIQVLAFESDMTRVFSFKTGRDASSRAYPESGTNKGFHPASHHGGRESAILEFNLINKYHVSLLPYFLDKLSKNTRTATATCSTPRSSCTARRWPTATCTTIAVARCSCWAAPTACCRATCTSRRPTARRWPT